MLPILFILSALLLSFSSTPFGANPMFAQVQQNPAWSFSQPLNIDPLNISGIVITPDFMALASDEGNQIELFKKTNANQWQSINLISLSNNRDEIDIEALAWQAPYLYVLGSHSAKRKKLKASLSQKDNIQRLQEIHGEPARQKLFRIKLDNAGKVGDLQSLSVQTELAQHPILKPFIGLPSKENGIDIEGLSIDNKGRLLLGLRGPVLRGNIVPVLRLKLVNEGFSIKKSKLLYLALSGNGIRGMSELGDQILVLSGAVGDQNQPYQVHLWNGKNAIPGKDNQADNLIHLCDLPNPSGKPEGIQTISRDNKKIEFVIVQDGLENGQPQSYQCEIH